MVSRPADLRPPTLAGGDAPPFGGGPSDGPSGPAAVAPVEMEVAPRRRQKLSLAVIIPGAVLVLMLFFCFLWPLLFPVPSPTGGSVLNANITPFSHGHLFGTDANGNDILARVLYGGRVSIEVGVATQIIGLAIGGLIGTFAGISRGWLGAILMRVLDVLIAFPSLVLTLAIAEGLGPNELHVIWALSFFTVPAFARVSRAATIKLRDQTFIAACEMMGASRLRIVFRHVVPNMIPQLVTYGLLGAGTAIVLEGALSFLGLGVPPPGASWGNMIASGESTLSASPYLVIIPSIFLLITVMALNLLGDGLRQRWAVR